MIRALSALAATFAFLLPPSALAAQDSGGWVPTGWEISPFVGVFDDRPEFHPDGSSSVFVDPAKNIFGGGHVAYNFASGLFVDAEGGYFPLDMRPEAGGVVDLDLVLFSAGVGYNIPLGEQIQAFGVAGLGASSWSPEGLDSETDLTLTYGGGARFSLTPRIALRAEARMHQVPDALANTAAALAGSALSKETFWGWGFTLGASFFLSGSGSQDSDRDGVDDSSDACSDTPMGASVDARGCALDSDRDGVADHADQCPSTPAGARVDGNGCATDGDDDGVADGLDRCPSTRAGAQVDGNGCATDGDRDGVPDGLDRCPNTRAGARVDGDGCALDGDRDGVPDGIDRCPDTAAGSEVDETGCPVSEIERELEEEGRLTFGGVNFANDSAELEDAASPILQEVGRVLSSRPGERVQLTGHTDSTGPEAHNRALSLRRAQAVRGYLLANFPSLDAERFEVQGAGESQPVADNGTDAGRRQNRRVEIVLGGTQ